MLPIFKVEYRNDLVQTPHELFYMENQEKSSVIVELYDLPLTKRKDDRFGRVVSTKSLSEDDLIAMAVSRRTDLSPATIRASMDIMRELALDQIVNIKRRKTHKIVSSL